MPIVKVPCWIYLQAFTERFPKCVDEYETLLTNNRIWKQRTVNIGAISADRALALGFTGPVFTVQRGWLGIYKKQPYEVYDQAGF